MELRGAEGRDKSVYQNQKENMKKKIRWSQENGNTQGGKVRELGERGVSKSERERECVLASCECSD